MLKSQLRFAIIIGFFIGLVFPTRMLTDALADDAGVTSAAVGSGISASGSAAAPVIVVPVPPALVDPVARPTQALSQVEDLYHSGLLVDAGILLAFFALTIAAKKVPWLEQDHRAVYVTALLGGLALLAVPAASGQTPNLTMDLTALTTVISLAINPKPKAS
jgi:hypothetical protein